MRMTNKSIQLLGFIPQPIEWLVRKKSFTTPSGKKAPINWLRMDPAITPNKSTNKIKEILNKNLKEQNPKNQKDEHRNLPRHMMPLNKGPRGTP